MSDTQVQALAPEDNTEPQEVPAPNQPKRVTDPGGAPSWCKAFPPNAQIPKGKRPIFLRLRAAWTETPHLGDRHCVCWGINVREEHIADKRAEDSGSRSIAERAKLTIRWVALDNEPSLHPVNPETRELEDFWDAIGLKCRTLITNMFVQTHSLNEEERRDFFENCVEVRDAV